MGHDALLALGREALLLMVLASLPPIGASLLVGLGVSLFQATTQLQESTLPVAARLASAGLALVLAGPWIARLLTRFALQLLTAIAEVGT